MGDQAPADNVDQAQALIVNDEPVPPPVAALAPVPLQVPVQLQQVI